MCVHSLHYSPFLPLPLNMCEHPSQLSPRLSPHIAAACILLYASSSFNALLSVSPPIMFFGAHRHNPQTDTCRRRHTVLRHRASLPDGAEAPCFHRLLHLSCVLRQSRRAGGPRLLWVSGVSAPCARPEASAQRWASTAASRGGVGERTSSRISPQVMCDLSIPSQSIIVSGTISSVRNQEQKGSLISPDHSAFSHSYARSLGEQLR